MTSIPQLVRRVVQVGGNNTATRFNGRNQSWVEFEQRISRLANGLDKLGITNGDRVACLALNSDRYMEFYFGVAWSGAVFVPINTRLAPEEILYWLNDSGSKVLFVDATFQSAIVAIHSRLKTVEHIVYMADGESAQDFIGYEDLLADATPVDATQRSGDDLVGIFYTGGTTGRSKGVMLSHRSLIHNVLQSLPVIHMTQDDVYLHAAPMFHIADAFVMLIATTMGSTHVFVPAFEPTQVMQSIQDEKVTIALLVPTMINLLVNHPDLPEYDLSSLKNFPYGGSAMPEAVVLKAMEVLPEVNFIQAYGQTEASPVVTLLDGLHHTTSGPCAGKLKAAGTALAGLELAILDEQGQPLSVGEVGEICVRGDNVMLGYWNLPELTAEALRCGVAGCIPETVGGWMKTAFCLWLTGSKI